MDLSPEKKKKMKKAKLSKSVAGQKLSKEAILNRMSSGKKRPKSETKIKKAQMKTPLKEDLVAKQLFFQDDDDDDLDMDQSPVKRKSKGAGGSVSKKTGSSKKPQSSTSKWQVSEATPGTKKEKASKDQEKDSKKKGKKSKKSTDEEVEEEDGEIDFPILKRKSLGLEEFKASVSAKKSQSKEQKVVKETAENGQSKKKKQTKVTDKKIAGEKPSKVPEEKVTGEDKGKKKKNSKRGKKRKRSNSESEEPQSKKEKPAQKGIAVRCGNLPVGVGKEALRMFIGEADVFPTHVIFKRKKKSGAGEKKQFVTYATIFCSTADEAEKLCGLNGISMPSPLGSGERKLLVHKLNDDSTGGPTFKKKLFVNNLHPKIKEDELMAFFEASKCNPTNVILPKKGGDKASRGYAFVWLSTAGDADRALKLRNPTLRNQAFSIARSFRHPSKQEP